MDKYIYGIDFGTTNSALSILDVERMEVVRTFNEASLLFFIQPQNSTEILSFVGQSAIDAYLGNKMTGRFMKSVKRILPRTNFFETRIYNKTYSASDLVTVIIKYLKEKADDFIDDDITEVILGRPVFFDEDHIKDQMAEERLRKAAYNAGFRNIIFQMEPIAAAFAYERGLSKNETVLVADVGGGTSDFTVMNLGPERYKNSTRKNDIIAQGGIYIGGDNFDSSFMTSVITPYFGKHLPYESTPGKMLEVPGALFDNITSWEKMNFFNTRKLLHEIEKYYVLTGRSEKLMNLKILIEKNLGYSIFREIEKTKIRLSNNDNSSFHFDKESILIDRMVSIENYIEVIRPNIKKIGDYLNTFLNRHLINPDTIDTVFITGGSAQVRSIIDLIVHKFGKSKLRSGDYLNSVSHGLAWSYFEEMG